MGAGCRTEQLLAHLKELDIDFVSYNHPAVLTVEAQAKYVGHSGGALSKNLFLKDKKHRYYIVSVLAETNVDLKVLSQRLGLGKGGLRMAPEESLQEILQVSLGCVTPFAVINETARSVSLLLDKGFKSREPCLFHPLSNEMTISLNTRDLDKFLLSLGRNPAYVDLEATPTVGKDQPPDLASLVPSEIPEKPIPDQTNATIHAQVEKKLSALVVDDLSKSGSNKKKAVAKEKKTDKETKQVAALDVGQLIDEIINKTRTSLLNEMNKDSSNQSEANVGVAFEKIIRKIRPDFENIAMIFKNSAYTEGFHAGVHSVVDKGFQGLSLRT